jgi:hypothetical protein
MHRFCYVMLSADTVLVSTNRSNMTLVKKPAGILADRSSSIVLDLVHIVTKLDIWVFSLHICVHRNEACRTFQNNNLLVYQNGFNHWLIFAFSVKFVCLYSSVSAVPIRRVKWPRNRFSVPDRSKVLFSSRNPHRLLRPPSLCNWRRGFYHRGKNAEAWS